MAHWSVWTPVLDKTDVFIRMYLLQYLFIVQTQVSYLILYCYRIFTNSYLYVIPKHSMKSENYHLLSDNYSSISEASVIAFWHQHLHDSDLQSLGLRSL